MAGQGPRSNPQMRDVYKRLDRLENDMTEVKGELKHMASKSELEKVRGEIRGEITDAERRIYYRMAPSLAGYITILVFVIRFFWPD